MLVGVILTLKVTGKEKHAPYTAISLNKASLIEMTTQLIYYSFLKKNVAVVVLHTYADETTVVPTAKFNPDFFAL